MSHAEQRSMYEPSGHPSPGRNDGASTGGGTVYYAAGRPASASRARHDSRPRSAGAKDSSIPDGVENVWRDQGQRPVNRVRPTSAPSTRGQTLSARDAPSQQPGRGMLRGLPEEGDYAFGTGADQFGIIDVDQYAMHVIGRIKGKRRTVKARRPTSAPASKQQTVVPRGNSAKRPTSAKARGARAPMMNPDALMRDEMMLPESGAMRFLRPSSATKPVLRVFSPIDSPQLNEAQFVPTWAQLSTQIPEQYPRQPHSSSLLLVGHENSHQSIRSSTGSRPGSAHGRPGSAHGRPSSAATSRPGSAHGRPGSAHGRSKSPAGRPGAGGKDSVVPLGVPRNPLATKTGTSMIKEVEGSFEPLQSQSRIPHYDSLHDPNLKEYWSRKSVEVGKIMKKLGHVRDEWAPDSGMFEASIGDELRRMYMPVTRDDSHQNDGPIAYPVPPMEVSRGALDGNVVSIEVSEEAVVGQKHAVPIPLSQPVLSCWLHWGKLPSSRETPDLDLSAVMFDGKARVTETVFYRNLSSHHEAVAHTGDDTDVAPGEEGEGEHDRAAGTRRMEGIVVELPRIPTSCHVIMFTVSCYTDETSLADASGAEMRVCVGRGGGGGLSEDIVRYYLTSERYNAAAPCILVRDPEAESGWRLQTMARVALGNVAIEMVPTLQQMLRQSGVCVPYSLEVEYCRAPRPTLSLRGRTSDFSSSFRAVVGACARAFPGVNVVGNPKGAWEEPRIGAFEVTLVDAAANIRFPLWSKIETKKWPKRMETIMQRMQRAMDARLPYEMPEDRSEVRVIVLDAVTRKGLPWSIVQVNALGLAAQKLKIASAKAGLSNGSAPPASKKKAVSQTMIAGGSAELSEKKTYRVQTDGEGVLNMRLPGGRYELLGLADGYVCEYPLEMSVRPFSKNRVIAKVAVLPKDAALDQAGGQTEEG